MNLQELIDKKLLIKSPSSEHEIEGSLAIAEGFLEKAEGNTKIEYYDVAFSLAYQAMFHAARAILFKNGFKERSHWAVIKALKQICPEDQKLAELLETMDSYRMTRHAVQYSGLGCSKDDAIEAINDANKLIELAGKILKKPGKK
jgi:uncharacterized protein (UPF0332 family)